MQIAVIGSGFSGLALCWYLTQNKNIKIDLYDPAGIGGNVSKMAAGLLHKYAGAQAKLNRFGIEGLDESLKLIKIAEKSLGSSVILEKKIVRVALDETKEKLYREKASLYSDCQWLNNEGTLNITNGIVNYPSLLIENGYTIDCERYLQGLWMACQQQGAQFFKEPVENLSQLSSYDAVAVAVGHSILQYKEFATLKITPVKGHLLQFAYSDFPNISLVGDAYITKMPEKNMCISGSTFEKNFTSSLPDLQLAKTILLPKITALFPPFKEAKIVDCKAGIRASTPDHLPIIGQFGDHLYAITGMGSKGLLYHALYAKKLSETILDIFRNSI